MTGDGIAEVLIIEDDAGDALLAVEYISEQSGGTVRTAHAATLREGLGLVRPSTSCVLLDLNLPDADGMAALRAVLDAAPAMPIVVLTGLSGGATGPAALERRRAGLPRQERDHRQLAVAGDPLRGRAPRQHRSRSRRCSRPTCAATRTAAWPAVSCRRRSCAPRTWPGRRATSRPTPAPCSAVTSSTRSSWPTARCASSSATSAATGRRRPRSVPVCGSAGGHSCSAASAQQEMIGHMERLLDGRAPGSVAVRHDVRPVDRPGAPPRPDRLGRPRSAAADRRDHGRPARHRPRPAARARPRAAPADRRSICPTTGSW